MDPKKDAKQDPKKDLVSELDLAGLFEKRTEAVKKQKETADRLNGAKAVHLSLFWLGGGAMLIAAIWATQEYPDDDPTGIVLRTAFAVLWVVMWIAAFFPTTQKRKEEVDAASKAVKDLESKISFCNQVLEEAKTVKVRRYAEAWVEKEIFKL
jgi:hypothetical protein